MIRWRAYRRDRSGSREVQAANVLVGLEHIADLLPGIIHVLLGVGFDDLGAVVRRDAETRIEIESMHPVRGVVRRRAVAVEEQRAE